MNLPKPKEIQEIRKAIMEGMRISAEKLKAEKKRLGLPIVISENGEIKLIKPEDI